MEKTFVDSLFEHYRSGLFHPDRPSIHAVMCSLYDVNKTPNEVIDADRFNLNVAAPQEDWVLRPPPRHVEAGDNAPNAKDALCVVADEAGAVEVAPHGPNNEPVPDGLHAAQAPDAPQAEPKPDVVVNELAPGAMHASKARRALLPAQAHHSPQAEHVRDDACTPVQVMYQSDSSSESSSMWRHLHEYYGSDSYADSVLPPPGVPLWKRAKYSHHSPASQKSGGASSSTASNPTPIKKKD
ncbi:hypothetical protein Salat_0223500 [Sesamum alatum]|uniref:Uncharacterized protein n=1 Tax=Sesamum alatum TaxID=300844 RepID=A0AAE2CYN3_9LAMI|nr:hypothetical protein Salat_0223500 [Sesamum alatum]